MRPKRFPGFVVGCTALGAVLVPLLLAPMWVNPELGRIGLRQEAREAAGIKFLFIGSLAGLAIGLAVDCAINGRPLREDWAIHRRLLPLILMATATLAVSAYCLWRIMTLPPTNY